MDVWQKANKFWTKYSAKKRELQNLVKICMCYKKQKKTQRDLNCYSEKKTKTDNNFKICKVLDVIKLEWICPLCERVGIRLYPNPGNTGILSVLM